MDRARILVVDDDKNSREVLQHFFTEEGHDVTAASDGREAIERLDEARREGATPFGAVVSDIRMADVDGLELLDWVQKNTIETPVILVTSFGDIDGAVDAIRRGAYDFIAKPYQLPAIKLVLERALERGRLAADNRRLKREISDKYSLQNVVGRSEAMFAVYKTAARVAATDATVLIIGESGTGKELVARAIHTASKRSNCAFIAVDCGAIAEGVLESELFGHARGSFTGATGARRGLFEEAAGGTIFLDEIGDIGPRIQSQLLRVLQEGEIRRVGESQALKVDTRVVAATNKDLVDASRQARFREDLYYRLNVVTIRLPPLRERREDIPLLAEHFAGKHAGARGATLTVAARDALMAYGWPGNVRELENAVARALALNPSGTILVDDLPEPVKQAAQGRAGPPSAQPIQAASGEQAAMDPILADRPTLDELTRRYAERVLRELGGNKTRAAEALGIDRKTLSRLLGRVEE